MLDLDDMHHPTVQHTPGDIALADKAFGHKLREELRECIQQMKHNEAVYDLVSEPELIDAAIYERQALICRYEYLLRAVKGTK